jgi:hypothetical protein
VRASAGARSVELGLGVAFGVGVVAGVGWSAVWSASLSRSFMGCLLRLWSR